MFKEILKMLKQPVTLTAEEMAAKFGNDTQTVLAALEQLERMGYLCKTCPQGNNGQNYKGCLGCANIRNTSNIRIYSLVNTSLNL